MGCDFIWQDPSEHLTPSEEKSRYDHHRNGDAGHRQFLQPVVEAVTKRLSPPASGLDWGSGPVPVLAEMLESAGFHMQWYDPFYQPQKIFSKSSFEFLTMSEVIEHVQQPAEMLEELRGLLRSGGFLVVMTEIHRGVESLEDWYYRRDPTHIGFYSEKTFQKFEGLFGLRFLHREDRVSIFSAD